MRAVPPWTITWTRAVQGAARPRWRGFRDKRRVGLGATLPALVASAATCLPPAADLGMVITVACVDGENNNRGVAPTERDDQSLPERWTPSTVYLDMWVDPDDDPREKAPRPAGELATLLDYLRRYRLTLEMKCADLNAEQLASRSVPPSTMSLLGLVRHLSEVERSWFRRDLAGQDAPSLYCADDHDGDWNGALADSGLVDEAWRIWRQEVAFAEQFAANLEDLGAQGTSGRPARDILVHMIEEYARHCGHADLLRERIDGRVGQ